MRQMNSRCDMRLAMADTDRDGSPLVEPGIETQDPQDRSHYLGEPDPQPEPEPTESWLPKRAKAPGRARGLRCSTTVLRRRCQSASGDGM